ncbi:hypothetical protein [Methylobacterium nonmethylotrophicum]|uniref:Uncharacterized protein n=1 Tax=Methylobacterium nonmethylotrophicum TaxID=1141884 RepID=A0A4Z0NNC4_9HYPH|nr:hypothetical protein [Methylobacterium nonmethylotrophicum]TGD97420.1 hypothetical protein EU555_19835 [Methylobacterium nonmethylotrophicum]
MISRRGDNTSGTVFVSYNFTDDLSASVVGTIAHFENDFVPGAVLPFPLRIQRPNINSTVYRVGVDATYRVTPDSSVGPTASLRYRDRNGFLPTLMQFAPANTRYGLGGVAQYAVTDALTLKGRSNGSGSTRGACPIGSTRAPGSSFREPA